jgi:hypothetical protein
MLEIVLFLNENINITTKSEGIITNSQLFTLPKTARATNIIKPSVLLSPTADALL